jgi:hypothetical protein
VSHELFALVLWLPRTYVALQKGGAAQGKLPPVFQAEEFPMSTITYDVARTALAGTPATMPVRKRRGLWARFMEARERQALQELHRHGLHLPRELEEAGMKIGARNEDSLPFIR